VALAEVLQNAFPAARAPFGVALEAGPRASAAAGGMRSRAPDREQKWSWQPPVRQPPANPPCVFPGSFSPPVLPLCRSKCIHDKICARTFYLDPLLDPLRIRYDILLHIQVIQHFEIGIHVVIIV